jgi:hypothetical protein
LDRDKRLLHVSLKNTGEREVYEDYYRPGFKLFSLNADGSIAVLKADYYAIGLYCIPTIKPNGAIAYTVPLERFAFLEPELRINQCLIFLEYNSKYGSTCSNTLQIDEPLPLGAVKEGNSYTYRAVEVNGDANKDIRTDDRASRR